MISSSIDDFRFTIQRGYLSQEFQERLPSNITNNVIVIPGDALLAANETDVELFINEKESKITEALECYLFKNKIVPIKYSSPEEIEDLAVINIETKDRLSYAPANLHKWRGSDYWDGIIKGYRRRINATRALMPNAKLSLFQVVRPLNRGYFDTFENLCLFNLRKSALQKAGKEGMFDNLNYLSPPCYLRFDISQNEFNDVSLTQAINSSLEITNSRRQKFPLAPFISFWIISGEPHPVANPRSIERQLDIIQKNSEIEIVVFWSGKEEIETSKYQNVDFIDFFNDVF